MEREHKKLTLGFTGHSERACTSEVDRREVLPAADMCSNVKKCSQKYLTKLHKLGVWELGFYLYYTQHKNKNKNTQKNPENPASLVVS